MSKPTNAPDAQPTPTVGLPLLDAEALMQPRTPEQRVEYAVATASALVCLLTLEAVRSHSGPTARGMFNLCELAQTKLKAMHREVCELQGWKFPYKH